MSMFDNKLQRHMYEWADNWGTPQRSFKERVRCETSDQEVIVKVRLDSGSLAEFCRLPRRDWDEGVRAPSLSSRQGNSNAITFFLYHWMEERNMLTNLFNKLKEPQNA